MMGTDKNLAQALAIESQLRLPGTAGRIIKQIRDVEEVAPLFKEAGLIKVLKPPQQLDLRVSGIATTSHRVNTWGGIIYGTAAVRKDLLIDRNVISSKSQDSVCDLDDIEFDNIHKRLMLIEMRQAYELVEKALRDPDPSQLILMDTPLFLNRDMVPRKTGNIDLAYQLEFEKTRAMIKKFWDDHRESFFPWNKKGPVLCSVLSERFTAIIYIARQDIRTAEGLRHLLRSDEISPEKGEMLLKVGEKVRSIGERRFIGGILSSFSRTAAFRVRESYQEMEPKESLRYGLVGFHFKGRSNTGIHYAQLAGDEPGWNREKVDEVCGWLMNLTVIGGKHTKPLPIQLAENELGAVKPIVRFYKSQITQAFKDNNFDNTWLSGIDGEL